jgi:prepilin-type N-terminal cleavage/methylation domain-containing protein
MMKNKGFTLMEVIIACAVLTLFVLGLFSLYSSGSKMGNATMWLQSTINQLKSAARQINTSIRKSSYPTKITFPHEIEEITNDCFKLQYKDGELITETMQKNEDIFLAATESTPAKSGFSDKDTPASLTYHIYTLNKNGDLTFYMYQQEIAANEINDGLNKKTSSFPPDGKQTYKIVLVRNVESVECHKKRKVKEGEPTNDKAQPIEIKINCLMPRSNGTRRSEITVGTPNVDLSPLP